MESYHIVLAFKFSIVFFGFWLCLWFCLYLTSHILNKSLETLEKLK